MISSQRYADILAWGDWEHPGPKWVAEVIDYVGSDGVAGEGVTLHTACWHKTKAMAVRAAREWCRENGVQYQVSVQRKE